MTTKKYAVKASTASQAVPKATKTPVKSVKVSSKTVATPVSIPESLKGLTGIPTVSHLTMNCDSQEIAKLVVKAMAELNQPAKVQAKKDDSMCKDNAKATPIDSALTGLEHAAAILDSQIDSLIDKLANVMTGYNYEEGDEKGSDDSGQPYVERSNLQRRVDAVTDRINYMIRLINHTENRVNL